MSKWIIGGVLLLAILVIAGLTAHKSVRAEIVINASPEEVWSVITDPQTYGEWNPIFVAYEGVFAEGNGLELQMKMGEGDATPVQVLVTASRDGCPGGGGCLRHLGAGGTPSIRGSAPGSTNHWLSG